MNRRPFPPWHLQGAPPRDDGSNVLLFFHSLTGEPDPSTWWPGLVGPGKLLDTDRWCLVTPDLVPDPVGAAPLTTRTMARVAGSVLDRLGIGAVRMAVGGSVGGMVALEWAAIYPHRTRDVVVFAAPAVHPAQAMGWNHIQREAIRAAGPERGFALARMTAMLTYRTPDELEGRFGQERRDDGLPQVASWLEHHGRKLVARYPMERYLHLLDAMDGHHVGGGRGGVGAALGAFQGRLLGVGIQGDLLYPPETVRSWCRKAGPGAAYHEIESVHGHDAFLLEEGAVAELLGDVLASRPRVLRVG
ncbi:MAG: alpha/beta fold hydrolase [Gemmatimonadales bacterium]|nr:MAG: alpha/beta fold hydrolase [Gemmatimonadales bacterium]